jgi:uncharacterized membrane protein
MEWDGAPAAPYRPNGFFFFLHVVLMFSLISGILLTLSSCVFLIIAFVPSASYFTESSAFQTSPWIIPFVVITVGFPFLAQSALVTGLIGIVMARAARKRSEAEEEKKYIHWTFVIALYNLILVGIFAVVSFGFFALIFAALSSHGLGRADTIGVPV